MINCPAILQQLYCTIQKRFFYIYWYRKRGLASPTAQHPNRTTFHCKPQSVPSECSEQAYSLYPPFCVFVFCIIISHVHYPHSVHSLGKASIGLKLVSCCLLLLPSFNGIYNYTSVLQIFAAFVPPRKGRKSLQLITIESRLVMAGFEPWFHRWEVSVLPLRNTHISYK